MSDPVDAATPPPDLAIRARPPSPRRLSRNVLLAGALCAAGIVALALFVGLGERPDREIAQSAATAAAGGPPESIRDAASNYAPEGFANGGAELPPPPDLTWANDAPAADEGAGSERPMNQTRDPQVDPEQVAASAAILFGSPTRPSDTRVAAPAAGARGSFLAAQRDSDERLETRLTPPRSRYELMAGSVIPAALLTELNSDLPGRAMAQVTSNVYDSISGAHLLIPQGARLIGSYDSATSYGDHRLLLVWNRLILPNGYSIALRGMEGADPTGAAGVRDRTDNHLDRLAAAIGLSAIISVIADNAEDDDATSIGQGVGDAAAAEAARTGGRIVERELSVRPTLRVRAGGPVRVLVTRDIELRPYRGDAH